MTYEELEKIKKAHDYCIIPMENIIGIEDNMPIQGFKLKTINIDANNGESCQFVNSDYFKGMGERCIEEESGRGERMAHTLSDLIEAHRFYSEKLKAVKYETLSEYNLRTCDCLDQREYDSLKAEKINALQSKIDGLEYFIDYHVTGMHAEKEG